MTRTPHALIKLHRQTGAALALSLMMMAVLTLLAVASMNSTLLEMLMAGNLQFQTRNLINAENTLATAERQARTLDVLTTYNIPGRYNMSNSGVQDPLSMSWGSADSIAASDTQNRYMLEYAGTTPVLGSSAAWGEIGTFNVDIIQVTAHSEGTKGAVRMVQSVYIMKSN